MLSKGKSMCAKGSSLLILCVAGFSFSCGCGVDNQDSGPTATSLAASHILIMHKYSQNCPPDVTRTQIEALDRAEEVAQKAQAPDADFAALAREFSDGASKQEGGDLGVFAPIAMDRRFSEATLALEIGEVSDPVRTGFGYHIILRKKPE